MTNKRDKKISILMPVFNASPFLEECLKSIIQQDEKNWELIAVDDFSSDDSLQILKKFSALDSRIRVLPNKRKGIIPALRMALSHSIGTLITRMDADDIMSANKLSSLKNILLQYGPQHVATAMVKYFSTSSLNEGYKAYEDWLNNLCQNNKHYEDIYKECVIPSPCWMVFKSDLLNVGAFENSIYPEDYDLCFRFRNNGLKVISVDQVLHLWRDHPSRISRTGEHYKENSFIKLKMKHFIQSDYNPSKKILLWGAGRKGKSIAKILNQQNIEFVWICDNDSKIGHLIYGQLLQDSTHYGFDDNQQIIMAVAAKSDKEKILDRLALAKELYEGFEFYAFC